MFSKTVLPMALIVVMGIANADQTPAISTTIDTPSNAYRLSVDSNGPGTDLLNRGDYQGAIDVARNTAQHSRPLAAHLVLCAALIRNGSTTKAQAACDRAIDLAGHLITTSRNPHGHKNRQGLAMAYSNRGVLRAVVGDHNGAEADFDQALRQNRNTDVTMHNKRANKLATQIARDNTQR